jgi:hypothetical protein
MSTITLESIEAKQSELQQLINKFKSEQPRALSVPAVSIQLAQGETYAGLMLGEDGNPSHHLILLAGDAGDLTWEKAKEWATAQGGELPTRREQSLLFANLKSQFEGAWYWSSQQHETNSSYAWIQGFHRLVIE